MTKKRDIVRLIRRFRRNAVFMIRSRSKNRKNQATKEANRMVQTKNAPVKAQAATLPVASTPVIDLETGIINLFGGIKPTGAKKAWLTQPDGTRKESIVSLIDEYDALKAPDALIIAAIREKFPETKFATSVHSAKRQLTHRRNKRKHEAKAAAATAKA
jgi:hypothetical protein